MDSLSLESLRKLNQDSLKLSTQLQEINAMLDGCHASIEGMADVAQRISKAFALYRELIAEMQEERP